MPSELTTLPVVMSHAPPAPPQPTPHRQELQVLLPPQHQQQHHQRPMDMAPTMTTTHHRPPDIAAPQMVHAPPVMAATVSVATAPQGVVEIEDPHAAWGTTANYPGFVSHSSLLMLRNPMSIIDCK